MDKAYSKENANGVKMTAVQSPTTNITIKAKVSVPFNHKMIIKDKEKKMTPSIYTQEMLQSTEERLANTIKMFPPRILEVLDMTNTTFNKLSFVDTGQALFQPYPTKLVFQNFTPGETYKLPLQLFNRDKVPRYVKLEQQESEYFHVVGPEDASGKVAPGLSATFTVVFTPQDNKDYQYQLVCATERERFEIPVVATGPRAILDFRDEVCLPACPVKATTERTQFVRNIGNSKAKFRLQTKKPFSVTPSSGSLDVGEGMQVMVTFSPMSVGDHSQDLLLYYHTGEVVYIRLYGTCEELIIMLDPDLVLLDKTYISLSSVQTVSLTNTGGIPLRYYWTTCPSHSEEEHMLRKSAVLHQSQNEEESHPAAIHRPALLSRNERAITLEPMEGEIWPNVTREFRIIFKPEAATLYQQTFYCDITGCESRLCLRIKGEGIGPKLEPSYNVIDMKNVVIGDKDWYEVKFTNKGLIDALFRLSSPNTTFGQFFSFSPEEDVVPPGDSQMVKVTFSSSVLGTFSEDLIVTVKGQPQPLALNFRGCVIAPPFHFDVTELNFGDVAFGFPQTAVCTLYNTSFVPMTFSLRVLGDGLGPPSVTCVQQVNDKSRNRWQGNTAKDRHVRPKEFTIIPAADCVPCMSQITIEVSLCSNTVKRYNLALAVDVEDVGKEITTLPINARCVVPYLEVDTPVLNYKSCFLNLPYEQKVQLVNRSSLPACYGILDQDFEEYPSLLLESPIPRGVVLPLSSKELPVSVITKAVGRLQCIMGIAVFGSTKPPLDVVLSCIGQGPIVRVQRTHLDFGKIPVLKDITKSLHLLNQSPIPAQFSVCMRQRKSFWRVEPREGEVPSEDQLELRVVAHLKDTLPFEDKLEVSVQNYGILTVAVSGRGTGTTIVSDKPFAPSLDLGTHFSHGLCQYRFRLTNHGLRAHRMYWRTDGFLTSRNSQREIKPGSEISLPPIFPSKKKSLIQRGSMGSSRVERAVFSLSPSRVELFPDQSVDMILTGSCDSPKVVRERLVCRSIVGNQGSPDNIMTVDVTCCFVAPMLSITPKQIHFYLEKATGKSITTQYKKLVLKNESTLTLSMELLTVEPFSLSEAQGIQSSATTKSMVLGEGRQAELWVCLNPPFCQDQVSRVLDEFLEIKYHGHPLQDMVELHGEVHFPNLLFSSTSVDFGCVLNSSETQKEITITNRSPLPVVYHWTFLDQKYSTPREAGGQTLSLEDEERHTNKGNENSIVTSASSLPFSPVVSDNGQRSIYCPVKVEEMFDVLPIHGHLQPGEKQVTSFSFFGHDFVSREVVALCHVEDGPTYEVTLRGEASQVSFSLDQTCVDFDQQLFDHVGEAEIILKNTGKVGFKFSILDPKNHENLEPENNKQNEEDVNIIPGQPVVFPSKGYIEAGTERCLRVLYLPGIPEVFKKKLQLQVACLPLQDITVIGEGVFPRVMLDLPQNFSQECYSYVVKQAKETVKLDRHLEKLNESRTDGATETTYTTTNEELLAMEIERILVKENALSATGSLLEFKDEQALSRKWRRLSKCLLPEYILDFGYVIIGQVLSQTVHIINNGSVTVSLTANYKALVGTGFSAEPERIKNLPCGETHTFTVRFDPQEAKLPLGSVCVVLPIQVRGGPTVQVQLCAVVTMPCISVSTDKLEFYSIQCGMCQMKTVQLFNHESVPCKWSIAEEVKLKKVNKFLPFYQRKQQPPPVVFEMVPSSGVLLPGKRVNVQVKFTPLEKELYHRNLVVSVAENKQKVLITAQGEGEEPQLEFCPPVLELEPCLPNSTEVEAEVTVKNPCSFPIEFYCVELDKQYLEEEKILRLVKGYDHNNMLLLPPRIPGEGLPQELLDFYNPKDNVLSEMNREALHKEQGHLYTDPVSRAIARHLGVDQSPDSLAALNCRGITIIVYGAPKTGISGTAASMAHYYGGALLSVDAVVTEVLLKGTSPVGLTARQLFDYAAAEYAKSVADTTHLEKIKNPKSSAPTEVPDGTPSSARASSYNGEPMEAETTQIAHCLGGDMVSLKTLLPEPLIIDILTERFQSSDCRRGIVIDGLKSVYTTSVAHTLQVVLKALNNRKHIYVVNLFDSYAALLKREKAQKDSQDAQQKETAENEKQWLQELDEEEYEALPEEKKHIIQRHRHKLTKDQKRVAKEQEEQRQQEELKRLKEEETKKNKKKGISKESQKKHLEVKVSNEKLNRKLSRQNSREPLDENKDLNMHEDQTEETKVSQTECPVNTDKDRNKPIVNELQTQFLSYEQCQVQVEHILQHWDRVQGMLLVPVPGENAAGLENVTTEKTPGKGKVKKAGKGLSPRHSQIENVEDKLFPADVIPHLAINPIEKHCSATELLIGNPLPLLDEVLDELGLGPSCPPIPPSVTLARVPFPKNRAQSQLTNKCFRFLVPSDHDKQSDVKKEQEDEVLTSSVKQMQPTEGRGRSGIKGFPSTKVKDEDKKNKENQISMKKPSAKTKTKTLESSRNTPLSSQMSTEQDQHQSSVELRRSQSLTTFRWTVPANGEVVLRIWFYSETAGIFEQTFNFELVGIQRHCQLLCKGTCTYPSICKDHMTLFAYSNKALDVEDDLQKTYVIKPGYFEFGPLLCSKTRDRYKENKYPENFEKLVIHNTSGLEAKIQFSFQNDTQAATYLLEPPTMTLTPNEKQELTVWAYPTKLGQIKDTILCKIKNNPESVIINLSCWGVRPELDLDTKSLPFDKTVIHRRVSRTVNLHNKTALPVSWRLQGIDDLGDLFSVPQDQGIVPPRSTYPLTLHFRAKKPLHIKKTLRLEVSDVKKILGIVHTESISVTAEAYDVSIKIEPGCLDFGTIKVFDEAKPTLRIRNHGKYEIAYKFTMELTNTKQPNLDSLFSILPQSGKVMPHDKSATVQIICKPKTEICIKEQPILLCQVIEPNLGEGGETIGTLVTKVSLQSFFSRYKITPACDINFGPLLFASKKTQTFTIENTGVFETRFVIHRMTTERPGGKKLPQDCPSRLNVGKVRPEFTQKDTSQTRITMGVFSVYPSTGVLLPGSQQQVTVDCVADQLGNWDQCLLIDISDRDPSDHPDGIPYRLLAEVYKAGIVLDTSSIFEEHFLCHNSSQLSSEQFGNAKSIYVTEENTFIFNKVLVGQPAKARFKLTNNTKVPCCLYFAIRAVDQKGEKAPLYEDIFHLSATSLSIPGQSYSFVEVTFTPLVMQTYHAVFEASVEGANRITPTRKNKYLEFDIIGEGILPSVCVVRPGLKNSAGDPLLQFRRVCVGHKTKRSFVLLNDGNAPAQVQIDMPDQDGMFALKEAPGNHCSSISTIMFESSSDPEPQTAYRAITKLNVYEQIEFEVSFCSEKPQKAKTKIFLQVKDNQSNIKISVTGEAYQEIVSLNNIRRTSQQMDQVVEEGNYETLDFGDCHVDVLYQENFTMVNHCKDKVLKFEWPPAGPQVNFSPQVGHLHAGCSKEMTVTFCSSQPMSLSSKPMKCKVSQVVFPGPLEQVLDWDDRQKTVHSLGVNKPASAAPSPPPVSNKGMKIDSEPSCSVVDGSYLELELRINAVCDYAKFSCSTETINFKDTMLYQTKLQQLRIFNEGNVRLAFSWKVQMDSSCENHNQTDEPVTSCTGSSSSGAVTRPTSALSTLNINPELAAFSVEPSKGTIEPRATQEFNIRFSPLEVSQFKGILICSIPNLQKKDQSPCVSVSGCSLMPHCHFMLENSNYICGRRCNSEMRSPLDPNTRVIEFNAVGLSGSVTKCFSVLNPTDRPYLFLWRCEDTGGSPFQCHTPSGTIQPKETAEVDFEYVSAQLDMVESLWSFVIDNLSVSVPFLLVGTTRAPLVYLDKALIDFGDLHVGDKTVQTVHLVNGEEEPFRFLVLQPSLLCEYQLSSLVVQPMAGLLGPKERLPLSVSFTPNRPDYVSFRVFLKVKRLREPLALTVKADCFSMSTMVQVEKPSGGLRELRPNHLDSLDFEKVGVSEQSWFRFLVSNLAKCDLDVTFDIAASSNLLQHLKAEPKHATLEVGKQLQLSLFFCPLSICNLQDVRLSIKVKNGSAYILDVKGRGVAPSLEFSFTKHNFGKCFVYSPGISSLSQTLVIRNKGKRDISVHCQFKNTSYLDVGFQTCILAYGADLKVPITFYPQEARLYQETLNFILNSCVTKQVEIVGQGIEMKLEVEDPKQRKINLGSLTIGKKVKKRVAVINRSTVNLTFSLHLNSNTPLDPKDLSVSPTGQLSLKPGESFCVEIQFSPRQHIVKFTVELQAEIQGLLHPLLTIMGSCQGVEVHLDQDHLAFGPVVQHCQTSKKIVLINSGDIGCKFCWKTEKFPSTLSISPVKGFIRPGIEVPFEVSFAPVQLSNDTRYENLPCVVEGRSSPITLTVTGSCIVPSTNKEVVNFVCPVRGSHTVSLSVQSPIHQRCTIRRVLEGEQWTCAPIIVLEPLQNKTFEVTYRPVTMTTEGNKHLGSIFFPFPDGTGMLYSLQGTAEVPKPEDTIVHELPAKTQHTELLSVHNWLLKQQGFHVLLEILKPDKPDATVSLNGLAFIDVPALTKRDYKLSFFTFKQGQYNTKVTFRNETTGEYLFYLITFKATSTQVLSTIELMTRVRQAVSASVQIENPLATNVCLTAECTCPDISVPLQHTVPGLSKDTLSFEYLPLQAGKSTARLTLSSNELGYFYYDLHLQALPAAPEKIVHFTTCLGSSQTALVKFNNFSRSKTEFSCKTDCPDFLVDKSVSAVAGFQAGSEASVEVCFEPHQLGDVRGQLTLYSALGGEYIFPLHGVCQPPKVQGPFSVTAGRVRPIPFKNVFLQNTAFSYQVDNPSFTVKAAETINSKKTQNILVSFETPPGGGAGPWFGRLTISSQRSEAHSKPCSWVYYLKGSRLGSS